MSELRFSGGKGGEEIPGALEVWISYLEYSPPPRTLILSTSPFPSSPDVN